MQLLNTVHTVAKNNNALCINKSSTPLTMPFQNIETYKSKKATKTYDEQYADLVVLCLGLCHYRQFVIVISDTCTNN